MTIPYERTRALVLTKEFLQALLDPKQTPRVPRSLRGRAKALLRHYPSLFEIEIVHKALPESYGPVPPFSRTHGKTAITELGLDVLAQDEHEFEPLTQAQHAVIAAAEPVARGSVISSLSSTKCKVCGFEYWDDPDGQIHRQLTCARCGASTAERDRE